MFMASPSSLPVLRDVARKLESLRRKSFEMEGNFMTGKKLCRSPLGLVSAQCCLDRSVSVVLIRGILIANCLPELVLIAKSRYWARHLTRQLQP